MTQQRRIWIFIGILLILPSTLTAKMEKKGQIHDITYTHLDNFVGKLYVPRKKGKYPVIIYNYHQFYDWVGQRGANRLGYNLDDLMAALGGDEYIVFTPIERYRKLKAILGTTEYLKTIPQADLSQIHLIGASEGGYLALTAARTLPNVKSIILISPKPHSDTGAFSIPDFLRHINRIKAPVVLLVGLKEREWIVKRVNLLESLLKRHKIPVLRFDYHQDKHWFWSSKNRHINDIKAAIKALKP